jgi:hypothetical protein
MARDYFLGNGDQTFRSTEPDWDPQGSRIFGGNGEDDISVFGLDLILNGGNGNDAVSVAGFYNLALGGNGDDWVSANGRVNTLEGGNGKDTLLSVAGGGTYETGQGNTLTGGLGVDTFIPSTSSDLVVKNDGGDGMVTEGDIVEGVFDVITDYRPGEVIQTEATTRIAEVGFDPYELPPPYVHPPAADHQHLLLFPGQYAIFQGDLTAPGEFTVGAEGDDLLLVWDKGTVDAHFFQWSVVLQDFSDPDAVWVA